MSDWITEPDRIYSGMVMDGPWKGLRRAEEKPYFYVAEWEPPPNWTLDGAALAPEVIVDRVRYVFHDGGEGRLPGWYSK